MAANTVPKLLTGGSTKSATRALYASIRDAMQQAAEARGLSVRGVLQLPLTEALTILSAQFGEEPPAPPPEEAPHDSEGRLAGGDSPPADRAAAPVGSNQV